MELTLTIVLEASIYIDECVKLEVEFISNVHQERSHIPALISKLRENEGDTNNNVDVCLVFPEEGDKIACAHLFIMNFLAAFLIHRNLGEQPQQI